MSGNLLEIDDLHVKAGEKEILKGLSLSVPFNEIHAIMGPNGAGKSVLSNVLSGKEDYKITSGKIIFKNENVLAFRDLNPQAPTHILVIPRKHISTINDLKTEDALLLGEILLTAKNLAKVENIDQDGFRTVFNCNKDGGQTVFHIHLHLLGGRRLSWPPG